MKPLFSLAIIICITFSCCKKEENEKPYVPIQLCADISSDMDTINKYIHGTGSWQSGNITILKQEGISMRHQKH